MSPAIPPKGVISYSTHRCPWTWTADENRSSASNPWDSTVTWQYGAKVGRGGAGRSACIVSRTAAQVVAIATTTTATPTTAAAPLQSATTTTTQGPTLPGGCCTPKHEWTDMVVEEFHSWSGGFCDNKSCCHWDGGCILGSCQGVVQTSAHNGFRSNSQVYLKKEDPNNPGEFIKTCYRVKDAHAVDATTKWSESPDISSNWEECGCPSKNGCPATTTPEPCDTPEKLGLIVSGHSGEFPAGGCLNGCYLALTYNNKCYTTTVAPVFVPGGVTGATPNPAGTASPTVGPTQPPPVPNPTTAGPTTTTTTPAPGVQEYIGIDCRTNQQVRFIDEYGTAAAYPNAVSHEIGGVETMAYETLLLERAITVTRMINGQPVLVSSSASICVNSWTKTAWTGTATLTVLNKWMGKTCDVLHNDGDLGNNIPHSCMAPWNGGTYNSGNIMP